MGLDSFLVRKRFWDPAGSDPGVLCGCHVSGRALSSLRGQRPAGEAAAATLWETPKGPGPSTGLLWAQDKCSYHIPESYLRLILFFVQNCYLLVTSHLNSHTVSEALSVSFPEEETEAQRRCAPSASYGTVGLESSPGLPDTQGWAAFPSLLGGMPCRAGDHIAIASQF